MNKMNVVIYSQLSNAMKTCTQIRSADDAQALRDYMDTAYLSMAMTNYPQPSNFLRPMPAWPANYSCNPLDNVNLSTTTVFELFSAIKQSTDIFYNYQGNLDCSNINLGDGGYSDNDMSGWNVLSCADLPMVIQPNGITDMFYYAPCKHMTDC